MLLKTFLVSGRDSTHFLGVVEDNCSTDNYLTHDKAKEMRLKGVDISLEIEGINATKIVDLKVYQVPLRDTTGRLHFIE